MKYLVTGHLDKNEKEEIEKKGLYCYDLRLSDLGDEIANIERSVLVNKVGNMITNEKLDFEKSPNDFINYMDFILKHEQVNSIDEMLPSKNKEQLKLNRKNLER